MEKILELNHCDRSTLTVHRTIKEKVQQARLPHEHYWQTYHRLLAIGLKYAHLEEKGAIAS